MRISYLGAILSAPLAAVSTSAALAQDFPTKPLRIITSGAGGSSDFVARQIAQGITGSLGQPLIVDNRGGGSLAEETASRVPADGYTMLVSGGGMWLTPLTQKVAYDVADFAPVSFLVRPPQLLVVHPSLPVSSVSELISYAKARPGQLNFAIGAVASSSHLTGELFKTMAGVNIVQIPYKGGSAALNGLMSGEAQIAFTDVTPLRPLIQGGKVKALAVVSAQPSAMYPELPTIAATLPGYDAVSMTAAFTRAKTPDPIIRRLNQEIVRYLRTPQAKERFLTTGVEVVGSPPEELAAIIKTETARMRKVIKDANIRVE